MNDVKQKLDRVKRDYENCLQDDKNLSENALYLFSIIKDFKRGASKKTKEIFN